MNEDMSKTPPKKLKRNKEGNFDGVVVGFCDSNGVEYLIVVPDRSTLKQLPLVKIPYNLDDAEIHPCEVIVK